MCRRSVEIKLTTAVNLANSTKIIPKFDINIIVATYCNRYVCGIVKTMKPYV